jgi:hypothetical protein
MKIQSVQIDLEAFGAHFANMDDDDQAAFLRGLASELQHWPSEYRQGLQFLAVADRLSTEHRRILTRVFGMLR